MNKIRIAYNVENDIAIVDVGFPENVKKEELADDRADGPTSNQTERLNKDLRAIHDAFVNASESNLFVVPFVIMTLIGLIAKITNVDVKEFLERRGTKVKETGFISEYDVAFEDFSEFNSLLDRFKSTNYTLVNYTKSIIIQLSTQFDILIAGIVSQIVVLKPSALEASERKIDFSELQKYDSIEDLKQIFVDKAIDSVVRKNRSDQFAWIGEKLGIPLTKDLDGWHEFIEINERRNLFTHTEGRITKEYIENCVSAGYKREKLGAVGDKLTAHGEYLQRANELFFVIGTKLVQVVWRKLVEECCKSTVEDADIVLIQLVYELNRSAKYQISSEIGRFACGGVIKRYANERNKRTMYVNFAASLMLSGKGEDARKVLKCLEWDASSIEFQVAVAAINDEVECLCRLIPRAHSAGVLSKTDLQEWPVFYNIRKDGRFLAAYKALFSEEYIGKSAAKVIDRNQQRVILEQMKNIWSGKESENNIRQPSVVKPAAVVH